MPTKISVIIVNWNSRDYVRGCLRSIVEYTQTPSVEIIVIDSASFDGCGRMIAEEYPQVRFIQSETNLGFAKSNNAAFRASTGEWVLFLNPDTELASPAIDILHEAAGGLGDCGIVGARLLNTDRTLQSSCIQAMPTIMNKIIDSDFLKSLSPRAALWGMAPLYDDARVPSEAQAISGACMMMRRSLFEQVQGFSEDYFMYAEDVDLSFKVRSCGYRNYYVPTAVIVHHGGGSSGQVASAFSAVMTREATWRFLRKSRGSRYATCYRVGMSISAIGRLLLLALSLPLSIGSSVIARRKQACAKWLAILRWTAARDGVVERYYPECAGPSAVQ